MTSDDFSRRHPKLFHVAFAAGWQGILRNGLWCPEELTRRLGWSEGRRESWLTSRRAAWGGFDDPVLGRVTFRDQGGIPKTGLGAALIDVSEADWYRELNRRVYFFVDRRGADRFAGAYSGQPQAVFTVDTERLLETCRDRVALSTINTGYAMRQPAPRGLNTFIALDDFASGQAGQVAEVTVEHGIENIAKPTTAVELAANGGPSWLWPPGR